MREAQAASATNHPNICTIHDIETAPDGQLFIVMAYYEGQTLKQRLASGPLAVDEALDIATQIADGLAKAHAQGVVHRDVKPGNVMLTEDGVRIVDFGLATFADALKLTVEHSTLGTAAYMSPEQVRGAERRCALGRVGRGRDALRDADRSRAVPGRVCRSHRLRRAERDTGADSGIASGGRRGDRAARLPRHAQRTVSAVQGWARARAGVATGAGPLAAARLADSAGEHVAVAGGARTSGTKTPGMDARGGDRRRHVGTGRWRALVGRVGPATGSGDHAGRERDGARSARLPTGWR